MPRIKNLEIRDNIIDAAFELFPHYGFNKTTIDDIVQKCEIAKGSFYLHFKNKEELLLAIIQKSSKEINTNIIKRIENSNNSAEALKIALRFRVEKVYDFVRGAMHGEDLLSLSIKDIKCKEDFKAARAQMLAKYEELLLEIINQGLNTGEFKNIEPKTISSNIIHILPSFMPPYILEIDRENLLKQLEVYTEMLIKSLKYGEKND